MLFFFFNSILKSTRSSLIMHRNAFLPFMKLEKTTCKMNNQRINKIKEFLDVLKIMLIVFYVINDISINGDYGQLSTLETWSDGLPSEDVAC